MLPGENLTPTQAESIARHKAFQGLIAERASKVVAPLKTVYFIPNVPFGAQKERPKPKPLRPIDWEVYSRGMWFYDLIWPTPQKYATNRIDFIINAVARNFGLSKLDIRSQRRTAKEVIPRQLAAFLCRELTSRSLPEIGRRLGGKDHTTILHAIKRTGERITSDMDFAARYEALKREISA